MRSFNSHTALKAVELLHTEILSNKIFTFLSQDFSVSRFYVMDQHKPGYNYQVGVSQSIYICFSFTNIDPKSLTCSYVIPSNCLAPASPGTSNSVEQPATTAGSLWHLSPKPFLLIFLPNFLCKVIQSQSILILNMDS